MKRLIVFSVVLCCLTLMAQEPQWKVSNHVTTFNQSSAIDTTTLFTPSVDGWYLVTFYLSTPGGALTPGSISSGYDATDVSGAPVSKVLNLACGKSQYQSIPPLPVALKAGQPFTYNVSLMGSGCTYNLGIVVENLQ